MYRMINRIGFTNRARAVVSRTSLVAGVMAVAIGATAAAPASASAASAVHWSSSWGVQGQWAIPASYCTYGVMRLLNVSVPTVGAADLTPGAGNDRQAVHYWTRLLDVNGVPLTTYAYAGGGWANDNAAAPLPVSGSIDGIPWDAYYSRNAFPDFYLQFEIAWYDSTNTKLLGYVERTQTPYRSNFGKLIPAC